MKHNVGLLVIATGKYHIYIDRLLESANKYFLTDQNVKIFLFTDNHDYKTKDNLIVTYIKHETWPGPTIKRYHTFLENPDLFKDMDYISYIDVDSEFVDYIDEEIVSDFTSCLHWAYVGTAGTPERNPISTAYIKNEEKNKYYIGGFFLAKKDKFFQMSENIKKNVDIDLQNNYIAIWHDESHLNRYLLDNPPEIEFMYPFYTQESRYKSGLNRNARIIFLDKDHHAMRS